MRQADSATKQQSSGARQEEAAHKSVAASRRREEDGREDAINTVLRQDRKGGGRNLGCSEEP